MGLCIRFFVGGDGNPVLAAEPMFHGEAPGGGLLVVVAGFAREMARQRACSASKPPRFIGRCMRSGVTDR